MYKYVYKDDGHIMIGVQPKGTKKKVYQEDDSVLPALERLDPSVVAQKEANDS